ncbi:MULTISPECIES: hypothetical protein [Haloarcula]|uniref:hypothetical protein n=1 Tax=Haloarcula TaxID=2237 RepID=UPI0023EC20CC|nr:hypothetical protein [Halomicroarcula sp. XH51]
MALASCAILVSTIRSNASPISGIVTITLLAVAGRVYAYLFAPSMMRLDPDAHAVRSRVIIENGDLTGLPTGFYSAAPGFNLIGALSSLVTGLQVDSAFVIFPIAVGVSLPLSAGALAARVAGDNSASLVAAAVVTVGAPTFLFGIAPIPIALAAIFLSAIVLVLVISPDNRIVWQAGVVFALLSLAGSLTHKIPLFLFALIGLVSVGYTALTRLSTPEVSLRKMVVATTLAIVVLGVQWVYITEYFQTATILIYDVFGLAEVPTAYTPVKPAEATPIDPPLVTKLRNLSYFFITVGTGAVAGLLLFCQYTRENVRVLQAAAFVTVGVTLPGIVGAGPGFQRTYVYASAFVAALIGIGIVHFARSTRRWHRSVAGIVLLAILIANPFAVVTMPDFPGTPREYLSTQEVEGKHFGNEYVEDVVYTDLYYGDEVVDFERAAGRGDQPQETVPNPTYDQGLLSKELKNNTLLEHGYRYISIRTNVEVWRLKGGRYRLLWNPERTLDSSRQYNRFYSNGGVAIYNLR